MITLHNLGDMTSKYQKKNRVARHSFETCFILVSRVQNIYIYIYIEREREREERERERESDVNR